MTQGRKRLLAAGAVVLAFAIGFGWQFTRAERFERRLATVERQLTFARIEATLGAAALEAHRGDYEVSRKLTSEFFTQLQNEVEAAPPETQAEFQDILSERDRLITLLSRSDARGREMLTQLYMRYRVLLGGPERALPVQRPDSPESEDAAAEPTSRT